MSIGMWHIAVFKLQVLDRNLQNSAIILFFRNVWRVRKIITVKHQKLSVFVMFGKLKHALMNS